jgi:gluconate 5-dehydrogenase
MARCLGALGAQTVSVSRRPAAPQMAADAHYRFDITDTAGAGPLVDRIVEEQGPIDILVNNAGVHRKAALEDMAQADFEKVLDVHLSGAFALTKAVAARMKQQGGGSVVFIASMGAFIGMPQIAGYAAAKAGLLGLTRALAVELGPSGIRVNAIAPGWIDTEMFRGAVRDDPGRLGKIMSRTPLAALGAVEDVGWACCYLASDAARFVTGVCLPVDGGALIGF